MEFSSNFSLKCLNDFERRSHASNGTQETAKPHSASTGVLSTELRSLFHWGHEPHTETSVVIIKGL